MGYDSPKQSNELWMACILNVILTNERYVTLFIHCNLISKMDPNRPGPNSPQNDKKT